MASEADELEAVKNTDITASIVLGLTLWKPGVNGKISIWEDGGSALDEGLLPMSESCGITKPFMDVAITPLGQGAGPACLEHHLLLKVNGVFL